MSQRKMPCSGEFYRDFKDKYYQIITVAEYTQTKEKLVVYQALYGNYMTFARPLELFLSQVDKEKYSEMNQKYCFERVESIQEEEKSLVKEKSAMKKYHIPVLDEQTKVENVTSVLEEQVKVENVTSMLEMQTKVKQVTSGLESKQPDVYEPDPEVERFMDASSNKEKQEILMQMKSSLTKKKLYDMAVIMDITLEDGTVEEMYVSLLNCIRTMARFDRRR